MKMYRLNKCHSRNQWNRKQSRKIKPEASSLKTSVNFILFCQDWSKKKEGTSQKYLKINEEILWTAKCQLIQQLRNTGQIPGKMT